MNRENEIKEISIEEIIPNRFQPRLAFDEKELQELSNSIKTHGIIQPLVLRRVSDKYEIIAGERRYKAASLAGLKTVPAIIMNVDDNKSAELAVVENLQRKNLTAIEEAQSYKKILDKGYVTQEELAAKMGVAQPTIANKLRLLNLTEEVQNALLKNQISERHARSLLSLTEPYAQIGMLNRIITERLTVKQTEDEINKLTGKAPKPKPIENTVIPEEITPVSQENNIFDINVEEIKHNTEDIIKEPSVVDLDMLLKPQNNVTSETPVSNEPIDLEETEANIQMGDIAQTTDMPINPFQESTEILDFSEQKPQQFEVPPFDAPENLQQNPIIEEFMQQKTPEPIPQEPSASESKSISQAINKTRDVVNNIQNLGFGVETEEFDFEDMYQIIIKIKKD